jgi:translation initiation factor IF-2
MSEEKKVKLKDIAKELNLGTDTIIAFLSKQKFEVPAEKGLQLNFRLSSEMCDVLFREFASDKNLKKKAEQIKEKHKEDKQTLKVGLPPLPGLPAKEEEEQVSSQVTARQIRQEIEEEEKPKEMQKPSLPAFSPIPEIPEIPVVIPESKPEIPVIEFKEVEEPVASNSDNQQETISELPKESEIVEDASPKIGIKVVGKIDLDKPKGKKRDPEPKPTPKPEPEPTIAPEPIQEEKISTPEPEPIVQQVESILIPSDIDPVIIENPEAIPVESVNEEEQVIRAKDNTPKLKGLTVLGKINIPQSGPTKKDSKPGDTESEADKKKRKRKRKGTSLINPSSNTGQNQDKKPADNNNRTSRPQKTEVNQKDVQNKVRSTMAGLNQSSSRSRQKFRRDKRDEGAKRRESLEQERLDSSNILDVTEFLSANELANLMDISVNDVIAKCMALGLFVSINQRIDAEIITLIAEEFGYQVRFVAIEDKAEEEEEQDSEENLLPRPPIVTVMGHVDHGKTSLLDYVRKTNVIAGEAGGITQHIGAYEVTLENSRKITFLDTPGHEAFTAMRARGAQVTDIVIIVIAADDQVMPQTREAITHAQAAGVPMVFAINKIDKPGANSEKIREQLSGMNILVEDWGGKFQCQEISAKMGKGIDDLLEKVLLEADLIEMKANPNRHAKGTVIEAQLDKGRGIVTTILVQTGTLRIGDVLVAGPHYGKVKAMTDERGKRVKEAGPSTPVQVLGLSGAPQAGDKFQVYENERDAREITTKRQQLIREQSIRQQKHITLDEIARRRAIGSFKELNIIVKGDVDGSVEALSDSLLRLSTPEVKVNIVLKGVGQISESDVLLASASDAVVIGFQVRPSTSARKLAEQEEIDIRLYSIIYDAINEVKDALEGLLAPEIKEEIVGTAEIREVFKISKVGAIAGCMVIDGKIVRTLPVRLIRDGIVVFSGKLASLKRFKDDAKEVLQGFECGLSIESFNDLREGDLVEVYEQKEVKRKLN